MLCFRSNFSSLLGNGNSPLDIFSSSLNDSNALNPKTEGIPADKIFLDAIESIFSIIRIMYDVFVDLIGRSVGSIEIQKVL